MSAASGPAPAGGRRPAGRSRCLVAAASGVLALAVGGCVSPAPTTTVYEAKAALTAQDAVSSSRTAVLAVRTHQQDRLTDAALEVMLQESELAMGSVTSTFDSVQPPSTEAADRLRSQLDDQLTAAGDAVRELRIAARRGDDVTLRRQAAALARAADELDRFGQEHQQ